MTATSLNRMLHHTPTDPAVRSHAARFTYVLDGTRFEVTLHEPDARRHVPEAFVHDLWAHQHFDHTALATSDGMPITVLHPGQLNTDGGPDFIGARVRIGTTEWAGDVEIHRTSREWFDHAHDRDPRYNSVILHVALFSDIWTGGLQRADETPIPELILHPHLQRTLRTLLHQFYTEQQPDLLCAAQWARVPQEIKITWIEQLARERMQHKREESTDRLFAAPNLADVLYEKIFEGLGYAPNASAMAQLARRITLDVARRFEKAVDLEALHFGVAGLLPEPADLLESDRATADYVMLLRERFDRMNQTLDLAVMPRTTWQFARLRPANFPPLRIAQGAALLQAGALLTKQPLKTLAAAVRSKQPTAALRELFDAPPTPFWETHVRMERMSKPHAATIGRSRIDVLLANAVAPVLLVYADERQDSALEAAVFDLLRALPAPRDRVTRRFQALGTPAADAFAAQGLHHLYRTRCQEARCLRCAIGQFLLKS